jgi:hypothetical protein
LPLEKLVNGKHFPINEKYFPVKENFGLVSRKVFSFYFGRKTLSGSCEKFSYVHFPEFIFQETISKFSCVYLPLGKLVNEKHFPVKEKFGLVFRKVFS